MLSHPLFLLRNLNRPPTTNAVNPTTQPLSLLCQGSYTAVPWPGTASTGTSGTHNLVSVP